MSDGIETVDFVDTMVEYGASTVDLNTGYATYSFVRYEKRGRETGVVVLQSAQPQFQAMLGVRDARFVYIVGRNPDTKKIERIMTAFSSGDRAYKIDVLDENMHGDRADAYKKAGWVCKFLLGAGIGLLVLGVLLLPFVFALAIPTLIMGSWATYKGRQYSKLFKQMVLQHKAIMAEFRSAESI